MDINHHHRLLHHRHASINNMNTRTAHHHHHRHYPILCNHSHHHHQSSSSSTNNDNKNDSTASENNNNTPPTTRLQREALTLVSLDVEYCHIRILSTNKLLQLPTEVCLIDYHGNELVRTMCNSLYEVAGQDLASDTSLWSFAGGTPYEEWIDAPSLTTVQSILIHEMNGKPVVGHNLVKDLIALGLEDAVPQKLRRDTMRYAVFQTARGFGSTLADLTEKKLGRKIQIDKRHDPREDALAALELYLQYCHYDPALMDYDDLVEYYLNNTMTVSINRIDSSVDD